MQPDDSAVVSLGGADYDWNCWDGQTHPSATPSTSPKQPTSFAGKKWHRKRAQEGKQPGTHVPDTAVDMPAGAALRQQADRGSLPPAGKADKLTLHGLRLGVARGELLGICGEASLSCCQCTASCILLLCGISIQPGLGAVHA